MNIMTASISSFPAVSHNYYELEVILLLLTLSSVAATCEP